MLHQCRVGAEEGRQVQIYRIYPRVRAYIPLPLTILRYRLLSHPQILLSTQQTLPPPGPTFTASSYSISFLTHNRISVLQCLIEPTESILNIITTALDQSAHICVIPFHKHISTQLLQLAIPFHFHSHHIIPYHLVNTIFVQTANNDRHKVPYHFHDKTNVRFCPAATISKCTFPQPRPFSVSRVALRRQYGYASFESTCASISRSSSPPPFFIGPLL